MKRFFDILFSLSLIMWLGPFMLIIALLIVVGSKGGVFFRQVRIGKDERPFKILKFRTMRPDSESSGQITVGARDKRITSIGYYLRKYKLDEIPQLLNILVGEMSVVGPRPEVPKYVNLYTQEQKMVLSVKPGLTDYASLKYFDENTLLAKAKDPDKEYIEVIMPEKLRLNLEYISTRSFKNDLKIIFKTLLRIVS